MRVYLGGDIALHGLISSESEANEGRFRWLSELLSASDGLIANLEAPVVSEERNSRKKAFFFADPTVTSEILKKLNVVCVSLANNHILDCGREGLVKTIRLLDNEGIYHSGAGLTKEQAAPVIFPLAGKTIGFTAWNHESTHPANDSYPDLFLNVFDLASAETDVRNLRNEADIVIASIHWGNDYSFFIDKWQRDVVNALAEAGADIIMGHHAHTLQPFEKIGSTTVFYGLGSLIFGDFSRNGRIYALYRRTKHSAVFMIDENCEIMRAVSTFELKGNTIVSGGKNIIKRNSRLLKINWIKDRSRVADLLLGFHEKVVSRVWEYFFGYYMNPFRRLLQFGNIKKIPRLFR